MIFTLALACVCVRAQHTVYCEVLDFNPSSSPKSVLAFNFGEEVDNEIVDEAGKKIKFQSAIDAIGYLEKKGWNVITAYSVVHDNGVLKTPAVHYLMKKEVSSYDEKMDGIILKKKVTKKKELGDDGYFE